MARTFQRDATLGEHAVIGLKTFDSEGNPKTASESTKIRILNPAGGVVVGFTAMTEISEGVHSYNYNLKADATDGTYEAEFRTENTTDNLVTLSRGTFIVEDL